MEGMGIWIFLLLFYLLQALVKRKQKQQRLQETEETSPEPEPETDPTPHPSSELQRGRTPQKPQRPVSLEDLFNPEKLRDILGVPQPEPAEKPKSKPVPQPVTMRKAKPATHKRWEKPQQSKPSLQHEEPRETGSRVASADITDVDESATDFRKHRMAKSDITSDRFNVRKAAPGKKEKAYALDFFDEPEDIRHAVILKEILDRPRAFRRNIR
ncbi:unnamed protein product [marine sediment metagenome]|uniref:Uncharacterized protein n=1 Tax=marine sediment metagenome TaxID=412755 RepID=X1V998_9ZZZZ